jgi:hypothetical protein
MSSLITHLPTIADMAHDADTGILLTVTRRHISRQAGSFGQLPPPDSHFKMLSNVSASGSH